MKIQKITKPLVLSRRHKYIMNLTNPNNTHKQFTSCPANCAHGVIARAAHERNSAMSRFFKRLFPAIDIREEPVDEDNFYMYERKGIKGPYDYRIDYRSAPGQEGPARWGPGLTQRDLNLEEQSRLQDLLMGEEFDIALAIAAEHRLVLRNALGHRTLALCPGRINVEVYNNVVYRRLTFE